MKHTFRFYLFLLCFFITGRTFAALDPTWQGKTVVRSADAVTTLTDGWYILYNVGRTSCVNDNGSAYKMAEMPAAGSYFSADEKGGMLFHITANGDKWHITSALGHNVGLAYDTSSQPSVARDFTIQHIGSSADVFYMVDTSSGYVADGQNRGSNFVGWATSPPSSTTGNSAYKIYPVEEGSAVYVTYHITARDAQGENPIEWTLSKYDPIGTVAGLSLEGTYNYVSDFRCDDTNVVISSSNRTFQISATHTFPMVPGKKYWIRQSGQNGNYMSAQDNNVTLREPRSVGNSRSVWSVTTMPNAPYFYLINEALGKTVKAKSGGIDYLDLSNAQAQAYECLPGADGTFRLFVPNGSGNNFGAHCHTGGSNSSVGLWNSGRGSGTPFLAEEVVPYDITITGHEDGRLNYDGVEYTDGTTLYIPVALDFAGTPKRVDGYVCETTTDGTHVTLNYRDLKTVFYTITYNYYLLNSKESTPHHTETFSLHYGDPLPVPRHTHAGYQFVKVPSGTVEGSQSFTIYCCNDNYEPEPDPVLPEHVNIVYKYYYGEKLMKTGAARSVANGAPMPGLDALPEFVSCSAPRGTVHYYEQTVEIPLQVTYTLPFKSYDSFASIDEWNNLTISAAKNLFKYEEGAGYIELNETGVKKEDKYLFAFVGDPFNGYRIYNKAAGPGMILSSLSPTYQVNGGKNTGEDSTPHMKAENTLPSGYNTLWTLKATGSNFFIRRHDDADGYINKRNDTAYSGDVLAFWTGGADAGSTVYITMVDLTFGESTTQNTVPTSATPADGKIYRIYSAYTHQTVAGHMVSEQQPTGEELTHSGRMYLTRTKTVRDRSQMWMAVAQSGTNAFQLINLESGRYMQVGGNTNENATTVFLLPTAAGNYGICNNAEGRNSLNTNTNLPVTSWGWSSNGTDNVGSNWVFEEVDYDVNGEFSKDELSARIRSFSPYAELVSGRYYRLKNENHTSLYMAENFLTDQKVRAVAENAMANPYVAVWKIEGNETTGFTFTNALTNHVIAQQTGWNAQYPTNADAAQAKTFFLVKDGGSLVSPPRYAFCPNDPRGTTNAAYSLHCQGGGNVLNWNYTDNGNLATASFWRLEEVEVPTVAELATIYQDVLAANREVNTINSNRAELSEKLACYFEDAACTRLQQQYRNITDTSLRVLMDEDELPVALQDIIISIKDGKWDATKDKAYNEYVGRFRIADYAPYSDRNAWNNKLRISATCYLTNPTGITVRSGEVIYLFVEDEPKEGATFNLEIVEDTNAGAAANLGNLHKGLNVFTASATGELFVNYKVADTTKYLERAQDLDGVWHEADYQPIKIHIEGGTANGYWDLSRGMTAEDWEWLCNNMFPSDFLHIKGNNTLLCLLTRNCRYRDHIVESMKIYDFIYTQELKYIGHDGQFAGRYKPSITIRDSYSGLFWNGSCANLAGHGIDYNSLINAGYWGICHEVAHGIQDVFNLAGLTEVTNNALVQMINHDFGVKSSRGISVKALLEYKNNGDTWIDVLRSGNVTWATNHLFFQLYLYFEHAGHMPGFMGRVCDKLREWGGIHQTTQNRVIKYNEDYLMFAKACAEVSQTDLYDFFDAWGFFGYSEDSHTTNDQDRKDEHIYYIGDYGSVSLRQPSRENATDRAYVEELKAYMKSRPNKAPNLLFINDRLKHDDWVVSDTCAAALIDPSVIGKPVGYIDTWEDGDFGMFYDFGADQRGSNINLNLNESTRTLTVSGDGIVGVKLCGADGNNRYVYNKREITLTPEIVQQILDGSLKIVVALGDNSDLPLLRGEITDVNGDGQVNIVDLALLIDYAGRCRNYTSVQISTLREKVLGK